MTPTKGERTRERIVATVAPIFNQRGYAGTSLDDVMTASGLKKGGIYRHFESKDELALSAFDHAVILHGERLREYVIAATTAEERLSGLARAIASIAENPPVPGGCPLLNTAIECDDGSGAVYTQLRARTRKAMSRLIDFARRIVTDGVAAGELRADLDADAEARSLIGSLEGALMLSKLYGDPSYVRAAADRAESHAKSLVAPGARRKRS
jgi:TetR/AcrR family transcriptional repressor of nem operon